MTFYFLTQVSKKVGLGHFRRTNALYTNFILKNKKLIIDHDINDHYYKTIFNNHITYKENFFSNINDSDYVFIDVYDFKKYSPHILNFNKIILLLDNDFDLENYPFFAIIIPTNYKVNLSNINNKSRIFMGEKLILLNRKLYDFKYSRDIQNLNKGAISIGGSDSFLDILIKLKKLCDDLSFKITVISNDEDYGDVFFKDTSKYYENITSYDFIICSSGQTLYECLYLGLVTLPIALTENQNKNLNDLKKRGIIKYNLNKNFTHNRQAFSAFLNYYKCSDNIKTYIEKTENFIDLNGINRVNKIIYDLISDKKN